MSEHTLTRLLQDILDVDPDKPAAEISRDTVESWDSLNHLRLVTALESEYGLELTMNEITLIRNVADIEDLITRHQDVGS